MPKASEYINFLVNGECSKLAISDVGDMALNASPAPNALQLTNQSKFVNFVNLANLAVHKRFHLLKKDFEMDFPVNGEEYTLPDNFLVPIFAYYLYDDIEVAIKHSAVNRNNVDEIDSYVSILFPEPFKAKIKGTDLSTDAAQHKQIVLQYAAAPPTATQAASILKTSDVYTEAILNYAAYKAHSSINGSIDAENNTYFLRYEANVKQLVTSGMWNQNEIELNTKLVDNGFV